MKSKKTLLGLLLTGCLAVLPGCPLLPIDSGQGVSFDPAAAAAQFDIVAGTTLDASFFVEDEELAEDLAKVAAALAAVADMLEGGGMDGGAIAAALSVSDELLASDDLGDEVKLAVVGARFMLRQAAAAAKTQAGL